MKVVQTLIRCLWDRVPRRKKRKKINWIEKGRSSKGSAVARASEDFMRKDQMLQTLYVSFVAFKSLLLGKVIVPDWDMFHSNRRAADFHGAARALVGCAVYISDKPST